MVLQENYNNLLRILEENKNLLIVFSKLYVFGSFLTINHPDDVDLLFIYKKYNKALSKNAKIILSQIEKKLKFTADITILSSNELKEVEFLNRLNNNYRLIWKSTELIY